MDDPITERLDTIIALLRMIAKQQGVDVTEAPIIGPFLGDSGKLYRVRTEEEPEAE